MKIQPEIPDVLAQVEKAVVKILKTGGQGVYIGNYKILTAAHCIDWDIKNRMLDEYFIEDIELSDRRMRVRPNIVEPMSDIAVLGSLDSQEFDKEVCEYEAVCEDITPVKICEDEYELFKEFKAFIFTQDQGWVQAAAKQYRKDAPTLFVESEIQINDGTSGGPIINEKGELLGITSTFSYIKGTLNKSTGRTPRPHLALPVWIYKSIIQDE